MDSMDRMYVRFNKDTLDKAGVEVHQDEENISFIVPVKPIKDFTLIKDILADTNLTKFEIESIMINIQDTLMFSALKSLIE